MITTSHQHGKRDEGSTILVTVMVMVIVASMLLVAAAVYMKEADLTARGKKSSVAVMAARSGVTSVVARIRAAQPQNDPTRYRKKDEGDAGKLPCGQTYTGKLGGSHPNAAYSATLIYYNQDPSNRDAAWLNKNKIGCSSGVIDAARRTEAKFVLIRSTGTNAGMERTVESVRALAKLDLRDLGGLVRVVGGKVDDLCWTAPQFRSGVNARAIVTAETCYDKATTLSEAQKEALKERQTWERRPDNRMMLTFSNDNPTVRPYCMQASMYRDPRPDSNSAPSVNWDNMAGTRWRNAFERAGDGTRKDINQWSALVLRQCGNANDPNRLTRQHFYTEGGFELHPINSGKTGSNAWRAVRTVTNLSPRPVMVLPYVNNTLFDGRGRRLDTARHRMEGPVGPGGVDIDPQKPGPGVTPTSAADKREKSREFMLVNYRMMGSCFDVEESIIAKQRMIVYPCHVHANIRQQSYLNQTFKYSQRKVIYTDMVDKRGQGSGPWCMKAGSNPGDRVLPYRCNPNRNVPKSSQWIINGMQDDPAKSFTVVNVASGLCMQGASGRDAAGNPIWARQNVFTTVVVAKCDGSQLQRWNYQAQISKHGEKMFREVPKGS